ncbi:MAG: hypothetical protein RMI91_06970 [Gemmatales bacterium]|nr:hypothetical protein [Gemmatales bacterium]
MAGENDLIRIDLDFDAPKPPPGVTYYLRRNAAAIEVWRGVTKQQRVNFGNNEAVIRWEANQENNEVDIRLQANQGNAGVQTYFVEWRESQAGPGTATLTFEARNANGVVSRDSVTFYKFRTTVIVIGGYLQGWTLDPQATNDRGIFLLASHLYAERGYDVHSFAESDQEARGPGIGSGAAYDEAWYAVEHRRVEYVVVMGFSYGGGATYNLVDRLVQAAAQKLVGEEITRAFAIPFTAYIDAIVHGSRPPEPVRQAPRMSIFHVNYYQRIDNTRFPPFIRNGIRGDEVQGSNRNVDVNAQPWGGNINHTAIDDNLIVLGLDPQQNARNEPGILGHFLQQVNIR